MPYKTEKKKLGSEFIKRNVKLLPCQKEMVVYWRNQGLSQRKLAKMFGCSRRLIIFIIDPEKLKKNKERREERGGWKQYYDKKKNADYQKTHRRYKHKTLKDVGDFPASPK